MEMFIKCILSICAICSGMLSFLGILLSYDELSPINTLRGAFIAIFFAILFVFCICKLIFG